ncbi:hypothetical protein LKMONMHP_4652 [Methylobacterium organophilum]|uniref:Uncharacterized protein n=1 Tax=Methylobacterium organophilum TaxID=410 RepID=A0ABQ4TH35_METOR|nr:hypothetical protein LKMONMHP_4652 [Methylobacterium organophilum]
MLAAFVITVCFSAAGLAWVAGRILTGEGF